MLLNDKKFLWINDHSIRDFYRYQGRLAVTPIVNFLFSIRDMVSSILVDFGCGSKIYKPIFDSKCHYIGVDLYNESADLTEDIKNTSLPSNFADFIICNQVIEHDPKPDMIIKETYRVLKENGVLFYQPTNGKNIW